MKLTTNNPFQISPIFEWNYNTDKSIVVNQGGTSCFAGTQKVITQRGSIPIKDIIIGDIVKCYNEKTKEIQWKPVCNLFKYNNHKKTIKVTLKNGETIIATEDHKFYYEGGWYSLKHLLSLLDGKMEKNTRL